MKIPLKPRSYVEIIGDIVSKKPDRFAGIVLAQSPLVSGRYLHWDKLRYRKPPDGLSLEEWWAAIKISRYSLLRTLPFEDSDGRPFKYAVVDPVFERLHLVDRDASGKIQGPSEVTEPHLRDRYILGSLIEEAITSSQLEGAVTTRRVAKEMITSGRPPRDRSEQMILNNYRAMQWISAQRDNPLTPSMVLEIHRLVTQDAINPPEDAGRLRGAKDDDVAVFDSQGQILHKPVPWQTLEERLRRLCAFANGEGDSCFIHPVVRAITIHFWLGYDHPFSDGNGRTARALFYWSMLREGYWLMEFVSISHILKAAPIKYARSFLYTETDENDVTYFIAYQLHVLRRAITALHAYLARKATEAGEIARLLRNSIDLNHRQLDLLSHALKHPGDHFSIRGHAGSQRVTDETARVDLLELLDLGLVVRLGTARRHTYRAAPNLADRLRALGTRDSRDGRSERRAYAPAKKRPVRRRRAASTDGA